MLKCNCSHHFLLASGRPRVPVSTDRQFTLLAYDIHKYIENALKFLISIIKKKIVKEAQAQKEAHCGTEIRGDIILLSIVYNHIDHARFIKERAICK